MKYTSVYRRARSPYWYISYPGAAKKERHHKATVYRVDAPQGRRKALDEASELAKRAAAVRDEAPGESWDVWVDAYIRDRYRNGRRTMIDVLGSWSQLRAYFGLKKIASPRALTYDDIPAFMAWRTKQVKRSGRAVLHNTALKDVKSLGVIMGEAVRRGYVGQNCVEGVRISKDPQPEKPEITPVEEAKIRASLPDFVAKDPAGLGYMVPCFEIAMHQGCRLHETEIPFSRINFEQGTVTIHGKGGRRFATLLHSALRPMLLERQAAGHPSSCIVPRFASLDWRRFFDSIGMPHLCFHCTRVTVVTRLARRGVPMSQAMSFVGHSSSLVHRIYTRLKPADLSACVAALT